MTPFTTTTQTTFNKMWTAFQNGLITECQWIAFCQVMLNMTLIKNQPMLVRMQNNVMTHIIGKID